MLSRVAERLYWFGRQLERAENTARLINVNANLLLDLPRMGRRIWASLIDITGCNEVFYAKFVRPDERNVLKFLLADESNPGSLLNNIRYARENARVTREIMPIEAWEKINEFYLYTKKHGEQGVKRDGRNKYLSDITMYCNQISGLLLGSLSHGSPYGFVRIGMSLERADMGTRIIDVGCLNLLHQTEADLSGAFDDLLWMNVLRSLSAYQMYRQNVKDRVNGEDVVGFILKDMDFPRSIAHCLGVINRWFSRLPRNDVPMRSLTHTQRLLHEADVAKLMSAGLHEFIDEIQVDFAELHTQIEQTWFDYLPDTAQVQVAEPEPEPDAVID